MDREPITTEQQELYALRRAYGRRMVLENINHEKLGRLVIDHSPPAELKIDANGNVTFTVES